MAEKVFKSPYPISKITNPNPSTPQQKDYNLGFFEYCAIKGQSVFINSSGAIAVGTTTAYTIPKDYTLLVVSAYYNCVFTAGGAPITYLFRVGGEVFHSFASTILGATRNLEFNQDFRMPFIFRSGQTIDFYVSGGPDTGNYTIQVKGILVHNSLIQI
jgi:hypothetical protein